MGDAFAELRGVRNSAGIATDHLCQAPFAQLHFDPDGSVTVCSKNPHAVGKVGNDRILDIWRGPQLAAMRDTLANWRFPASCASCAGHLERENVATHPSRDFESLVGARDPDWPERLEFAFSDLCNLACIHCSPRLSSVLRARAGLPKLPRVYDDAFFAELEPILPHLRSVSFLGGEPLLQKEVHRVCDRLIALGLKPGVFVTTNGTVFDARIERLLSQLPVNLAVSLDAASARTFERVREGARWDVVRRNLDRFVERMAPARGTVRLNFCVMRATWMELPGFLSLAAALPAQVWVTVVTHPTSQSLLSLPPAALRVVHDRLVAAVDPNWPQKSRQIYASVLRTLATTAAHASAAPKGR